jgi:phospholipid-translocating ATPase
LIDKNQRIFQFLNANRRDAARYLDLFSTKSNSTVLVIDGPSLQVCLDQFEREFIELACQAPSVICCRCSPTQKAEIVRLMKLYTGKRAAAIGDGGNDVRSVGGMRVVWGVPL